MMDRKLVISKTRQRKEHRMKRFSYRILSKMKCLKSHKIILADLPFRIIALVQAITLRLKTHLVPYFINNKKIRNKQRITILITIKYLREKSRSLRKKIKIDKIINH